MQPALHAIWRYQLNHFQLNPGPPHCHRWLAGYKLANVHAHYNEKGQKVETLNSPRQKPLAFSWRMTTYSSGPKVCQSTRELAPGPTELPAGA